MILELWNGENYPDFLREVKAKYTINETAGTRTENESYEDLWDKELKWWNGSKNIKQNKK